MNRKTRLNIHTTNPKHKQNSIKKTQLLVTIILKGTGESY